MMLRKFDRIENFEDVKKLHDDMLSNFSFDDIGAGDLKTTAPTTSSLAKGRCRLVEESGVPVIYYRNLSGTIYKTTMVAA